MRARLGLSCAGQVGENGRMLASCARCGGALRPEAIFCPDCGAPVAAAPPAAVPVTPLPSLLRLAIDGAAMRHFLVGTRCALRMRVEVSSGSGPASAIAEVGIAAEVQEGPAIAPAKSPVGTTAAPMILTLWLVPELAGFYEVRGVVHGTTQSGERHAARFSGLQFRVAADSGQRISVVNIDQRSARVVDNSRTSFAVPSDDRGGLVSGGEWHEVPLSAMSAAEVAAHFGVAPAADHHQPEPRAYVTPAHTGPVRFSIKAENAAYEVTSKLAQGELATIYDGRRNSDGLRVAVKIADDKSDNDLIQAEVSALALLCAEDSPQRKHLPNVLDRFHTRDGRLGTVFEFLDGFDQIGRAHV